MKQILTIKELIDYAYNKYKSKKVITVDKEFIKNINYFNYRFDIYSLARAMKNKIKDEKIAIISENRYEFNVAYLANAIINNKIFIIDYKLKAEEIKKVIQKYEIKTIFISNKSKEKILNINEKINEKLNLINFDSNNEFPIIEYEKLINIGRYIENYSIENIDNKENNSENLIIVNLYGIKEYKQEEILNTAKLIAKNIKIRKRKAIKSEKNINTFYKVIIKIIIPLIDGLNIKFESNNESSNIKYDIKIIEENKNNIEVSYKNIKYTIEGKNNNIVVKKVDNNLMRKEIKRYSPNFVLIKSHKSEKIKNDSKKALI